MIDVGATLSALACSSQPFFEHIAALLDLIIFFALRHNVNLLSRAGAFCLKQDCRLIPFVVLFQEREFTMKPLLTSRFAESVKQRRGVNSQVRTQRKQASALPMSDARAASLVQLQYQQIASQSSQTAQLKARAEMMAGRTEDLSVQRVEDEELLQAKFSVAQLEVDGELLQGKRAPVQRVVEEERLQGKFDTVQRKEPGASLQGRSEQTSLTSIVQRDEKPNDTGLPDQLKSGIESLSGMSMDHVKVHYNSDKPGQLQAHAYAQGSEIHVAPGQERHVPHEAWHVVQQAQGRVKPTMQMKAGVPVNDDVALETEADVMGAKAAVHSEQDALFSVQRAANAIATPGTTVQKMTTQEAIDLQENFEERCNMLGLAYDEEASLAWVDALSEKMAEQNEVFEDLALATVMKLYEADIKAGSRVKTPTQMIADLDETTVQKGRFITREVAFMDGWRLEHITIEGYAPDDKMMAGAVFAHAQIRGAGGLKNYYLQLEPATSEIGEQPINQAQQNMSGKATAWKSSELPADVREGVLREMRLIAY